MSEALEVGDLVERVRRRLADEGVEPSPERVARAVRQEAGTRGDVALLAALRQLRAETVGAGPLQVLLDDEAVTDVIVNAPDEVWVDRGQGLERAEVTLTDEAAVRRLAQRLVAACGRRLDDAAPFADARLPDGTRVHAVLPPISPTGTCLSLRVPPRRAFTLDQLGDAGTVSPAGSALLHAIVTRRLAFVVSGGTGTGKTTLLSTLLSLVPPGQRLLLVEDSAELRPTHPHVVRLEARPANVEGSGAVTLAVLVRQALRMRPDRIVVGEVRGAEVVDLLAALNTGHDGGCGTVHANRAVDVPARLEALAAAGGLSREALHSQLAVALHVVVHLTRGPDGRRRLADICVLQRGPDGCVVALPAFTDGPDGLVEGAAAPLLRAMLRRRVVA